MENVWLNHCVSFHLRVIDTGAETFYFLNRTNGSYTFCVHSRQHLCELFFTPNDRAQLPETIGRRFVRARFNTDFNGQPINVLVIPRVSSLLVNRNYHALNGLTIKDCRDSSINVYHGVISNDTAIHRDPPFALSCVQANDPSGATL